MVNDHLIIMVVGEYQALGVVEGVVFRKVEGVVVGVGECQRGEEVVVGVVDPYRVGGWEQED